MSRSIYSWQKECLSAWQDNKCRGIVSAVTGSGKTFLALCAAASLLKQHPELRIRIVAPTIALANQWRQAVIRTPDLKNIRPGFYGDGIRDDVDCQIMIYVINSARSGLAKHVRTDFALGRHVLLICDECHRYKSKENHRIFSFIEENIDSLPLYSCLGLSATPFNGDRDDRLTAVLGREIYSYNIESAILDETIAPFTVCQIAADFLPDELEEYRILSHRIGLTLKKLKNTYPYLIDLSESAFMKEVKRLASLSDMDPEDPAAAFLMLSYQRKDITVMAETRIRCCMKLLESMKSSDRIIIFSERIEQAEGLYRLISRRYGNIAGIYHSQMTRDARIRVLGDFRENRARILVSCRCLDEGLDVPDANIGIVLSSSAVPRQRIQRLGRIVRCSTNKDSAVLYYIYVRESTDDRAYLPGADSRRVYDLRYYSREDVFSNDMYEYAAAGMLAAARSAGMNSSEQRELRLCINEGLCMPDCLLEPAVLKKRIRQARSVHEKNYYNIMYKLSQKFIR